jgi:hypothetical protein
MTESIEGYESAQAAEYSTFVAVNAIFIGGARAFNPGHPVPASAVAAHPEWLSDGDVAEAGSVPAPAEAPTPPQGDPIVNDPTD